MNGHGVAADPIRATELFQSAANKGEADAQNHIGWLYYQGNGVAQDYAQAMSWYRKAANQGHADAQNNVGWLYDHGNGVAQDYAQAMFCIARPPIRATRRRKQILARFSRKAMASRKMLPTR